MLDFFFFLQVSCTVMSLPEDDVQEFLVACFLVPHGDDEVAMAAGCAVEIEMLL